MKNNFKHLAKVKFICTYLLLLIGFPAMAQLAPAQLLNETRTFEVTACNPSKKHIIAAWMEKRSERKDNSNDAADMRVAYKSSANNGTDWTEKGIIDLSGTFSTGNPYVTSNTSGEAYLVCMHIGKDFFSGNISLYEFDFAKKQFNLKSVPIKSEDKLLDKPAIVSFGNEIHLTYISYDKRSMNMLKYQMSGDKGKTWTEPVNVFNENATPFLGPSISVVNKNQIVISVGSYGNNGIYLVKKKINTDTIAFEDPVIVAQVSNKLRDAMTELSGDGKKKLLLTWQYPHQREETWMTFSTNEGNSWASPLLVTEKGNLLSAAFDKQSNIHCIYSDFTDQHFFVKYKSLNSRRKVIKEGYLVNPMPLTTFDEYLGAFQKLLIQKNKIYAFWIDYPNESALYFTKWKM
ncbi:hypothetical protein BZG01_16230 [Labilibaculum manganireducens]|uniref:Sialidase domain-containing protein n=1 Tax=Labilibaculum manganireducens TaxID=1940525 RepID=A0A2N3HYX6_9BACT|nr:hypothetical protein [Labilibaculum manganireducens]PKQ63268.1 hypothetical protein BZG01_16230 [Labilibaculum manganireducens]